MTLTINIIEVKTITIYIYISKSSLLSWQIKGLVTYRHAPPPLIPRPSGCLKPLDPLPRGDLMS